MDAETITRRLIPALSRKRRVLPCGTRPRRVTHDGGGPPAARVSSVYSSLHFGLDSLLQKRWRGVAQDLSQRVRKKFLVWRVGKR
jgi:hypothetical protein